ncbi:CHASE2 domain-containing protein [Nitrosomonas sp.]|uniref:CHASE2 domain-containing protein n=1 Tax=Nitrosomonas sp. TaxID=42353 RepID=UPI002841F528|nr:CHASE2 domain-containing protein [Nitrosomonas sp.]MDR4515715.1 CHASE2 domain-containing protein [Nitrosomonas sp.]
MKSIKKNSWQVKATHASLTGLLFATFIAIILVIFHALDFNFMRKLEQMGIDWGMQIYAFHPPSSNSSPGYEYVFIDVDHEACKQFINKELDPECLTSKPVPSNLIIDFVRAASESGAKIVIVDVNPPEKHEQSERETLLKGLTVNSETSDTWVIAPIYSRPGESVNGLVINGDKRFDIISNHAQGKVRLASVATYAVQGTVRSYPTASCLVTSEEQRWVPTIPYLAALLANEQNINAIDDRFYNAEESLKSTGKNDCSQLEITSEHFSNNTNTALNFFDPFAMDRIPYIIEFFYSVPGLSMFSDEQEREKILWNHSPKYSYYKASNLFNRNCSRPGARDFTTERCFATREDLFENKIIILGSGQAQAMDKVNTPIGPMSGSELMINATRAFLEFSPLESPPLVVMIWDKFKGILVAIGPIVAAWFVIFATGPATQWIRLKLMSKTRKSKLHMIRKCRWNVLNVIRSIMVVIIFLTGLYVAYLLEIMYLWSELKQGAAVDLLYPVIALGIQGYTVGARVVLTFFQGLSGKLIGFVRNIDES